MESSLNWKKVHKSKKSSSIFKKVDQSEKRCWNLKKASIFKKDHRIIKKEIVNRRLDGPAHLRTPQASVNKNAR